MIDGKRVLGLIPARGGSKGIPRKNIRVVSGKPLIWFTIHAAGQSRYLDHLVVTSEDEEIRSVAEGFGVETIERPTELARDDTPGFSPVLHAVEVYPGYDWVVLLQPTSPLRNGQDIDAAIEYCISEGAPGCVTVSKVSKSPYWMFTLTADRRLVPLMAGEIPTRRQDVTHIYELNGAAYVANVSWLKQHGKFVYSDAVAYCMPDSRSLDIDTESDIELLEYMLYKGCNY